jgi:hypothetical protein
MTKLRTLKLASWLKKKAHIKPIVYNVARWRVVYLMAQIYMRFSNEGVLSMHDAPSWVSDCLFEFGLTSFERTRLNVLMDQLKDLDEVTLLLQEDDIDMAKCRFYLDEICKKNENHALISKVDVRGDLKMDPDFETGVVKIMLGGESSLSASERSHTAHLRMGAKVNNGKIIQRGDIALDTVEINNNNLKLKERFNKHKRLNSAKSKYISPTSVFCHCH